MEVLIRCLAQAALEALELTALVAAEVVAVLENMFIKVLF